MRTLLLIFVMLMAGCTVTVPASAPFDERMLQLEGDHEAVLFFYATPQSPDYYFKHILVDGVPRAKIANDTFARIVVEPGERTIRMLQHGYQGHEPWIIRKLMQNPELWAGLEATRDILVGPGAVHFIAVDMKERTIYFECAASETATQICSKDVMGAVLEERPREAALQALSSLREACDACE